MTAIVGVLNSRGLAFAADSAATHTSPKGHKITNHANKIFTLSKYHPVGVALYNNLDFMGVPWDTIIKMFRNSIKEKEYSSLEDYIKKFWEYVKKNCLTMSAANQLSNCKLLNEIYYQSVKKSVEKIVGEKTSDNAEQYYNLFVSKLEEFKAKFQQNKAEDFKKYPLKDFKKYAGDQIDKIIEADVSDANCPLDFRNKYEESVYTLLCHDSNIFLNSSYTGLIFFGYGEKELFPSYREYVVSYAIDNHIKYKLKDKYQISGLSDAVVAPFAQKDVASTIIWAVENTLCEKFYSSYKDSLKGVRDEIVSQLTAAQAPQIFIDILNGIDVDKYSRDYRHGMNQYIKENFTDSLIGTVAYLSKEDLADMAESLVRMTCIKRRITLTEETVGGPVDVAVVTKGDGFIWMQRKHYFDPKFNPQFFERYKK